VLDIIGKVIGLGSQPCVLFFSGSFIKDSHVCIVLVFLNIPAFQAAYFIYIYNKNKYYTHTHIHTYIHLIKGIAGLLSTSWPGTMWGVVKPGEFVEA
jgi:hypothetical protein